MHIFFSGIGGAGLGPLALIAHQAGYSVSGSDKQNSNYLHYLREHGIEHIEVGQSAENIAADHAREPIDWYVYSSAVAIENPDAPELKFCQEHGIRMSKRDELLNQILDDKSLKLIAVAGTHGKTTTTAMLVWLLQHVAVPISWSIGGKIPFGEMGHFDPASEYFIYEADEYDRNFLSFHPLLSLITGIDYDHPDVYPTRDDYNKAFRTFIGQSGRTVLWHPDAIMLEVETADNVVILDNEDPQIHQLVRLAGQVNRMDAWQVGQSIASLTGKNIDDLLPALNAFPGVYRRFEQIIPGLYSDYAHTPPKIRGTLETAAEIADGKKVIVVYEGLHNTRQHFIKDELKTLFDGVDQLYIVPSYLAREDTSLKLLTPSDLKALLSDIAQAHTTATELNDSLEADIRNHIDVGDIVVCITAGGGGSLDEWLRARFS
jgi:UDP-N-acetylmuramate--alanine ligase